QLTEWDKELDQLHARNGDLGLQVQMLQSELVAIRTDRPEIQEAVPTVAEFPEPADLLNRLKARRKKSRADLADMQTVLDILSNLKE
ncbi:MAG: flagellar alpha dynein, partial [Microcoleus sp.]